VTKYRQSPKIRTWRQYPAAGERIAGVSLRARAHGDVVDHVTLSILSAGARAGVPTLVPDTCLVPWALRVEHTLGSARFVRVARVLGYALAHPSAPADGVRPTGRRVARVGRLGRWCRWKILRLLIILPGSIFFLLIDE
jgi:hypothetical protein